MRGLLRVTSVNRLFGFIVAVLFAVVAGLSGWLLTYDWHNYREAEAALVAISRFRASLLLMERVSAERGPMNALLGADLPPSGIPDTRVLQTARALTDKQMEHLQGILSNDRCSGCAQQLASVQLAQTDLAVQRERVDALIRVPRDQRTPEALADCVNGMVAVIPDLLPAINASGGDVIHNEPGTLDSVIVARLAAELREYAGLIGSQFTVALARHRPLTPVELLHIERTRGRVDELATLIEGSTIESPLAARAAFEKMNHEYFGDGLDYVATVRAQAIEPPGAPITAAEFAAHYVPLMHSITEFRDVLLDDGEKVVLTRRSTALMDLVGTAAGAALLILVLLFTIALFRRRVVKPLVDATRVIGTIARGNLKTNVPHLPYRDEIAEMYDAIRVLKASAIEKVQLEAQRDNLMIELEVMAQTDFLTNLPNRRAFEKRARLACEERNKDEPVIALFMFDIDHFKRINDTYGHEAGDRALVKVAELCRAMWRQSDVVARVGGEEFAALTRVRDRRHAVDMAERLRVLIESTDLHLDDGAVVSVTASFGIALAWQEDSPKLEALMKIADKMLYRAKEAGRNRIIVEEMPVTVARFTPGGARV